MDRYKTEALHLELQNERIEKGFWAHTTAAQSVA